MAQTPRYEIRDRHNPRARGMRFSTVERARKELAHAFPPERWFIYDRQEKKGVRHNVHSGAK